MRQSCYNHNISTIYCTSSIFGEKMKYKELIENWDKFLKEQDAPDEDDEHASLDGRPKVLDPKYWTTPAGTSTKATGTTKREKPRKDAASEEKPEADGKKASKKTSVAAYSGETICIKTNSNDRGGSASRKKGQSLEVGILGAVDVHALLKGVLPIRPYRKAYRWGHPFTAEVVKKAANDVTSVVGFTMGRTLPHVGNISVKNGGPIIHSTSHQQGIDIDIGYYTKTDQSVFPNFNSDSFFNQEFDVIRNLVFINSLTNNPKVRFVMIGDFVLKKLKQLKVKHKKKAEELREATKAKAARKLEEQASTTGAVKLTYIDGPLPPDPGQAGATKWKLEFQDVKLHTEDFHIAYMVDTLRNQKFWYALLGDEDLGSPAKKVDDWNEFRNSLAQWIEGGGDPVSSERQITNINKSIVAKNIRGMINPAPNMDTNAEPVQPVQNNIKDSPETKSNVRNQYSLGGEALGKLLDVIGTYKVIGDEHHNNHYHIRLNFPSNSITVGEYLKNKKKYQEKGKISDWSDKRLEKDGKVPANATKQVTTIYDFLLTLSLENINKIYGDSIAYSFGEITEKKPTVFHNQTKPLYGASSPKTVNALVQIIKYKGTSKRLNKNELEGILQYKGRKAGRREVAAWKKINKLKKTFVYVRKDSSGRILKRGDEGYKGAKRFRVRKWSTISPEEKTRLNDQAGISKYRSNQINRTISKAYRNRWEKATTNLPPYDARDLGALEPKDFDEINKLFGIKNNTFPWGSNLQTTEGMFRFFSGLQRMVGGQSTGEERQWYETNKKEVDQIVKIQKGRKHSYYVRGFSKVDKIPGFWGKGGKDNQCVSHNFVIRDKYAISIYVNKTAVGKLIKKEAKWAGGKVKKGTNPGVWKYSEVYAVLNALIKKLSDLGQ